MFAVSLSRSPMGVARVVAIALLLVTFVVAFLHFSSYTRYDFKPSPFSPFEPSKDEPPLSPEMNANTDDLGTNPSTSMKSTSSSVSASTRSTSSIAPAAPTWTGIATYIKSILDPDDKSLDRLDCPRLDTARYSYLHKATPSRNTPRDKDPELQWLFAIDLRSAENVLPRLLGSVVEVVNFLGPEYSFISVVEGNSNDRTLQILAELAPALKNAGIPYSLTHVDTNPSQGNRIQRLAALRNKALLPLTDLASRGHEFSSNADVIFLNDVAICPDDILELMHQKRQLGANMVCPFDWTYVGHDPTFYDIWIARTLQGDTFFDIPPDGNWNSAWNLFWNDEYSRSRFSAHRPFQVFSCWNGAVVFPASIVMGKDPIRFRARRKDECEQGEPELFCKDMWIKGLGRIAVIPSIHLEYSNEAAKKIKGAKGYVNQWTEKEDADQNKIEWSDTPPELVRCMPGDYAKQSWAPWNEGFQSS